MEKLTEEELYKILKSRDWSFDFSDDHGVWERGRKSLLKLQQILQEVKENQPELINVIEKFYNENVIDKLRKQFRGTAGFYTVLENYFNKENF